MGRSNFIEPYKRSTEHQWMEQEEEFRVYLGELAKRFSPILQAYYQEDRNDMELAWSLMETHGIKSHHEDVMLFSQYLWREARQLEEHEPDNVRRIDQVYEMLKAVGKIFEVRAGLGSVESDSIYLKTDDATFWHEIHP
ncbi:hypothetical protein B2I21_36330 [Chryseobacterium mucoviscidosis]|nr:hypothetical protein B2I21_36330 [Chryseobacterium mucoviscidosis]